MDCGDVVAPRINLSAQKTGFTSLGDVGEYAETFARGNVSQTLRPRAFYSRLLRLGVQVDSFMKPRGVRGDVEEACLSATTRKSISSSISRILNIVSLLPVARPEARFGKVLKGQMK